jgi:hypothetical protein
LEAHAAPVKTVIKNKTEISICEFTFFKSISH